MRTIKFRGYNLKNKKWIYGYYFVNRGKHFIADDGLAAPGATWEDFEVEPESVGQFIGYYYNTELYEGDIVEHKHLFGYSDYSDMGIMTTYGVMEYDDVGLRWGLRIIDESGDKFDNFCYRRCYYDEVDFSYKVLGTIYEKKEEWVRELAKKVDNSRFK